MLRVHIPTERKRYEMEIVNTVKITKDYGKIKLKLRELMDKNGVTRNNLARKVDVRFEVIDRWFSGDIEKLDLDILARICFVMNCGVEDILEYTEQ